MPRARRPARRAAPAAPPARAPQRPRSRPRRLRRTRRPPPPRPRRARLRSSISAARAARACSAGESVGPSRPQMTAIPRPPARRRAAAARLGGCQRRLALRELVVGGDDVLGGRQGGFGRSDRCPRRGQPRGFRRLHAALCGRHGAASEAHSKACLCRRRVGRGELSGRGDAPRFRFCGGDGGGGGGVFRCAAEPLGLGERVGVMQSCEAALLSLVGRHALALRGLVSGACKRAHRAPRTAATQGAGQNEKRERRCLRVQ